MTTTFPVAEGIHGIDLGLLGLPEYGATYVVQGRKGVALVEVGTSLCVPRILDGLEELGLSPDAVTHILLTHVHLDHAGAAGHLLTHMPQADVVLHPRSHRHMVDPSRLLAGVEEAVGPQLFPLYGEVRPLDAQRLLPAEGLHLNLGGGVRLEGIPTPGHARDHVVYFAPHAGILFTGDATGISVLGHEFLRPVTAPPHFDLERTLESLELMRRLGPAGFCFTHFGCRDDVDDVLNTLRETLLRWDRLICSDGPSGAQSAILADMLPPPNAPHKDFWRGFAEMNLRGFYMAYGAEPVL